MKRFLILFTLIIGWQYTFAFADSLFVQESEETWFVTIRTKHGQSALEIAKEYNTPTNLLLNYNNIDADKIFSNIEYIDIPLNEVNFYKNYSIKPEEKEFVPLFYRAKRGEKIIDVCNKYEINQIVLRKWNTDVLDVFQENTVLLVGWLKVGSQTLIENYAFSFDGNKKNSNPSDDALFEQENNTTDENTIILNHDTDSLLEAENRIKDIPLEEKTIETITVASTENIDKIDNLPIVKQANAKPKLKLPTVNWQKIFPKSNRQNHAYKKDMQYAIQSPKQKPVKNDDALYTPKKKFIDLSFLKKKKNISASTNTTNQNTPTTPEDNTKIDENPVQANVIDADTSTTPIYTTGNTSTIDENTDESEKVVVPISNKNSVEGNCGFLFSGNNNGQYYAFTNLATKGSIITIRSQNNSLRAKVMGTLDAAERNAGYIIMLSDNAKQALKTKVTSLKVSIDY